MSLALSVAILVIAILIIHHHILFPLILRARPGEAHPPDPLPDYALPTLSILVPAYREAAHIGAMVEALKRLDYPAHKLDITIACDGSPDETPHLAREAAARATGHLVRVLAFVENRGKVAVLNSVIAEARGEIVLLLDASSVIDPDSARKLVASFTDPHVHVVCPGYALLHPASAGEAAYWRYQRGVKRAEAAFAHPMGAHGAGYAFRRGAWTPLPSDTINDDFVLPMRMVAHGARAIYRPDIVIADRDRTGSAQETARRRRLGAGNLQQVWLCRALFWQAGWRTAFAFFSGKALRAVMPLLLLLLLGLSTGLAIVDDGLLAKLPLLGQLGLYGMAALGALVPQIGNRPHIASLRYAVTGYGMMLLGMIDLVTGRHRDDRRQTRQAVFSPSTSTFWLKRLFDLVVGAMTFVVFVILLPFLALAIRLDSRGPVFYRQLRVGRALPDRTELFCLVKFRTMRVDAESATGAVWAAKGDPRVTRLGNFLRKTRLDELPQCLNVLRGEMSIVGPRPERPAFFTRLETAIPFYSERTFGLKPGVTGLAQVSTGYDATIDDVRLKVLFDHAYALQLRSPWQCLKTDVAICLKTFLVMGLGLGR